MTGVNVSLFLCTCYVLYDGGKCFVVLCTCCVCVVLLSRVYVVNVGAALHVGDTQTDQ
jgi:hypothetical protein